jgi:hypothetical protein
LRLLIITHANKITITISATAKRAIAMIIPVVMSAPWFG